MGMDLHGKGGYFRLNCWAWENVLKWATSSGWKPLGTSKPKLWSDGGDGIWKGGYDTNDGQRVLAKDARALADALERALPGVEARDDYKAYLAEFVAYCRKGSFIIK